MKTFIKVEIDDNTFIELPIECVKECGTFVFDADNIEKWMQNDEIQKQFHNYYALIETWIKILYVCTKMLMNGLIICGVKTNTRLLKNS